MRSHSVPLVCGMALCGVAALSGCSLWEGMTVRSQSPNDPEADQPNVTLVGDLAVPYGMFPVEIGAVGLVTRLRGTGSDPKPSPETQLLIGEMQTRGVPSPSAVLASPDTALVKVRGVLRPGIQKGDRFDVEVRVLSGSETTSLRGGRLLETDLKEFARLTDNRIHTGHTWGRAEGPIMVDPAAEANRDRVRKTRGWILGGGVALKSRPLALILKPESQSVLNSARIETAVNKRFHAFSGGTKIGMAKALTDQKVELRIHPRYKDNVQRYVQVVRAIALRESETMRQQRLDLLEKQLLDPITSSRAALQLEAVGGQAVEVLLGAIESPDAEVRFYAAQALAYLDQSEAAEPLAEAARRQPAFRAFALSALATMDDMAAAEQLRALLNGSSAETRYGAFRALTAMNPNNPVVMGESLGGQFNYHVLNASGTPMIHVARTRRPEIVLFGADQRLKAPVVLEAGNQIMVVGHDPDQVAVSKFAVGEVDQKRIVSSRVDEVIRAIVELGGTYPDVVQALQEADRKGALSSRFAVEAVPEAGRAYDRVAGVDSEPDSPDGEGSPKTGFLPDLVPKGGGLRAGRRGASGSQTAEKRRKASDSSEEPGPVRAFFARMTGNS